MKAARKTLNAIGWRYALLAVLVMGSQIAAAYALRAYMPEFVNSNATMLSYLLMIFSVDVIGFPFILLLMKKFPKWERTKEKLGAKKYFGFLTMCYPIMLAGSVVGTIITLFLTGSTNNAVSELLTSGDNVLLRILTVGVCAPVFEELIFRKILIDRLAPRGKLLAILTSALAFGMFHGNFSQFFYAAGLGLLFAYVYVKTGKIWYTISYHMIINLMSSVVAVKLLEIQQSEGETVGIGMIGLLCYEALIFGLGIIGVIVFIRNSDSFSVGEDAPEETSVRGGKAFGALFSSVGIWLFIIVCSLLFVYSTMSSAASASSVVTKVNFTEVITVDGGQTDVEKYELPLTIEEDGEYILYVGWKAEEEPGYLTGVVFEDAKGNNILYATGSTASIEFVPTELEAGDYTVVFYYISNVDDFRDYLEETEDPLAQKSDKTLRRQLWKDFGDDGEYEVDYEIELRAA